MLSALSTMSISIAPVMSVVACGDTEPISSDNVKSTIDNNGNIIMMKSKDYDIASGTPASTPAENEQNFTNWFSSQVDTIGGFSGTAVNTDYTVQILDSNSNPVYQGWADSEVKTGISSRIYLKEVEVTPIEGSQHLTGNPIKFYLTITPYLSFTGYFGDYLPSADKGQAPKIALDTELDDASSSVVPKMDLTNVNSESTFLDEFFNDFTHNLIGWNLSDVKNNTKTLDYTNSNHPPIDWSSVVNKNQFDLLIANKEVNNNIWFDYNNDFSYLVHNLISVIHN
ncbi:hypothetical protein [Spiroplasma endosymbiont of Amphibalanus improvisus]|uniref:hypothetical protein n=1 Tax=Spiroplasma endosymbiont of Amphibalanus improvisus TaxID=3066327 RepID=UPI00313D34F2